MGFFSEVFEPLGRFFNKSWGERQISRLMGGVSSTSWGLGGYGNTYGRQELGNHYTGFNYLAIQPLMKELSAMTPHAAFRDDGMELRQAKAKALYGGGWDAYNTVRHKYMTPYERSKAIAPIATHEELIPVSINHDFVKLLRNPNGPDTSATFFKKLVMNWKLYGEFYIWLVPQKMERLTGIKGPPAEMWVMPSHWMWPKHDSTEEQIFSGFEVRPYSGFFPTDAAGSVMGGWFPGGSKKAFIPADQIVYYCEPNPTGFIAGYSALTAISHWVDCADAIDRSRTAQFQNGAFPGVVIEFDKTITEPDKGMLDRLEARIAAAYTGVKRTGRTVMLSPGCMMKPIDHAPFEMSYQESADQVKDWIFAAHGTGQSIVGLVEQTTFNNVWGARANFYSNTIKPMCTVLSEIFTEKIASKFDKNLVCYWPDTSPVDPDLELRKYDTMLKNNVMTVNEVCALLGLEPKPWGDKPLDQLRQVEWANQGSAPAQAGAAAQAQQVATSAAPAATLLAQNQLQNTDGDNHATLGQNLIQDRLKPGKNGKNGKAKMGWSLSNRR